MRPGVRSCVLASLRACVLTFWGLSEALQRRLGTGAGSLGQSSHARWFSIPHSSMSRYLLLFITELALRVMFGTLKASLTAVLFSSYVLHLFSTKVPDELESRTPLRVKLRTRLDTECIVASKDLDISCVCINILGMGILWMARSSVRTK